MVKEIIKDEFFLKQKSKSCTKEDLYIANELLETIVEFKRIYPEVNISVVSGTHEELFELLVDHRIDMKISEQRRTFNNDYYNENKVFLLLKSQHFLHYLKKKLLVQMI